MVNLEDINESLDKTILKDIVAKRIVEVVKCTDNSATKAGDGGVVHMANDPDGERVPKRRLQHKGFDENGNDLGYIADIKYPNGNEINYYEGTITLDGETYQMGFFDNFDEHGNHITKGSANGEFKYQWQQASDSEKRKAVRYSTLLRDGTAVRLMEEMERQGLDFDRWSTKSTAMNTNPRIGALVVGKYQLDKLIGGDAFRADNRNLVTGEQISKSDTTLLDMTRINSSKGIPTNQSVGMLNDSTLHAHNTVTGETRSLNGKVNNWDNTWKVYTLITQGDGTHAMYLGYPQNVGVGAWDNSGNPLNGITYASNQHFKRVMVDKENGIVVQVPVNE